jgi:hypothetical protein
MAAAFIRLWRAASTYAAGDGSARAVPDMLELGAA